VAGSDSAFVAIEGSGDIRRTIPEQQQREEIGRLLRRKLPRRLHGLWQPAPDRPDPLDVVRARNRGRQQRLIPIRLGRMVASPFAFYRGSADLMAIDLRATPSTGLVVQLCGDAHLSNFGVYGSPERRLTFDINDFDETGLGRWEWDLKRLVASIELCGRDNGHPKEARAEAVATASRSYRVLMQRASGLNRLEVHYLTFGEGDAVPVHWSPESLALLAHERKRAYSRTNAQLGMRMTQAGGTRLRSDPPLLTPVTSRVREAVLASLDPYQETVSPDIQELLKDYGVLDVAHKVVGVGSVGTRDYVVLLQGNHVGDELFLQVKEALPSVVSDPELPRHHHHGRQVVDGPPVLCPPAAGHEGRSRSQAPPRSGAARLRRALRRHPGEGPCPHRLPDRHRHLLWDRRALRPRDGGLRPSLRRPGRAGPRRARQRGESRRPAGRAGHLSRRRYRGARRRHLRSRAVRPPGTDQDWVTRGRGRGRASATAVQSRARLVSAVRKACSRDMPVASMMARFSRSRSVSQTMTGSSTLPG
jgi:uncharacterized protein (DUF2252 family)